MVVLVNEQVHLPASLGEHLTQARQHGRSVPGLHDIILRPRQQETGVCVAERIDFTAANVIHPVHIPFDAAAHGCETDPEHQVGVPFRRRMVIDVEPLEQRFEPVLHRDVVIMTQHRHMERFPEPARPDVEEEPVGRLDLGNEGCLVHVVIVFEADRLEIRHSVGQFSGRLHGSSTLSLQTY